MNTDKKFITTYQREKGMTYAKWTKYMEKVFMDTRRNGILQSSEIIHITLPQSR